MHALSESDEALASLLPYCHRRRYPSKTPIIRPGNAGDTLYYIIEGAVTISMPHGPSGDEIILAYLNKGDFIGEIGVFMEPMPRDVTVTTREPSQLAEISYIRFSQLLKGELAEHAVSILSLLGRQLSRRLLHTSRKVSNLAFLDVSGRIAHTLMELCQQPDALTHPDGMEIRITRQELGRIVGCSREMAGRVIKSLQEQGLLLAKGKTIVVYGTR